MAKKKAHGTEPPLKKSTSDAVGPGTTSHSTGERTAQSRSTHWAKSSFPIVGIGASAGGLEALQELLDELPGDTGMGFVVLTHQHPGHASILPELLGKRTKMPVVVATDGTKVKPDHVYVGPAGGRLAILNGHLQLMETNQHEASSLPIDYFFRSLAADQHEQAICIVLSGTGTDGTIGLQAIKGHSGMAMVELPEAAKYAGMPSSAISTGLADYVLPPAAMPKQLVAYANGPYLYSATARTQLPTLPPQPMNKIFLLLRSRTGHDFSGYKSNTIRRRIERRMNVHQIEEAEKYVRFLQENPHEIDILFQELLISVTNFFRDPEAWDALVEPLQQLLKSRPDGSSFRAWIPGCATGEEAFSLAILLRECLIATHRHLDVQVFGTDLDAKAIETARAGQYPDGIAVDVSPLRLDRNFARLDSSFRVLKEVREMTIFAPQNVITDPPFTKLDIILCRNLLIYLNAELQKKLLPIFHYALKPEGLLFLGTSETIGEFTDLFEPLDKRYKIFRRKEYAAAARVVPQLPARPRLGDEDEALLTVAAPAVRKPHLSTILERLLLARFAPASVVVNERGDIVFIHGRTGAYLEPSQGQPRTNILEMAREGLQIELALAIRQCASTGKDVARDAIRVKTNGDFVRVDLGVAKLQDPETVRDLLLVTFCPTATERPDPAAAQSADASSRGRAADGDRLDAQLERELQFLRESHRSTLEELETSSEELKSTNEELQSTNEELQSANEELETSKEEMQSLNEELTTVNAELQSSVDDLSQSNDDMQNLLNSTDIATLFLDNELNIKLFTEQAKDLVKLRQADIGRPISELASNLVQEDLVAVCRDVLETLISRESEVSTTEGGCFLMRIRPYRTTANMIGGVVITLVDIRQLKETERLGELLSVFESIVDTVRQPLLVLDEGYHVAAANQCFYDTFRLEGGDVVGTNVFDVGGGAWDIPKLRELLQQILPDNTTFEDFEVVHEFPGIGRKVLLLNACRLKREQALPALILLAMEDVTNTSPIRNHAGKK